jgi:deferrochelatase/peroxidase EfeB
MRRASRPTQTCASPLAYQREPRRQFAVLQRLLATHDALSAYACHVGSAVFALPPGARPGGFTGDRLFA